MKNVGVSCRCSIVPVTGDLQVMNVGVSCRGSIVPVTGDVEVMNVGVSCRGSIVPVWKWGRKRCRGDKCWCEL